MTPAASAVLLFLAGGCGTLARFGCHRLFYSVWVWNTPWGTAIVNIVGCFCFGMVAELFERRAHWPPEVQLIILTGFFGAFTTFSTYMFEIGELLKQGNWFHALGGFLFQNGVGFAALVLGILLARHF